MEFADASGFKGSADQRLAPRTETELQDILREASRSGTPVTFAGAWTSLTGAAVPQSGWVVSLENFRKLEIEPGLARVGAGVALTELQAAAKASRQLYGPDPTENTASMGGMIATNASGARSFYYGATRRHIRSLRVVFADGTLREFRRGDTLDFEVPQVPWPQTTKHAAGFPLRPGMDWIDLLTGSEGVLGVVTQAEVGLFDAGRERRTGVLFFDTEDHAWDAVDAWRAVPGIRMLEYLGCLALDLVESRQGGSQAALFVEQEIGPGAGDESFWDAAVDFPGVLADQCWIATSDSDREGFRRLRHQVPERINAVVIRNGFIKLGSDAAVPANRNQEMLRWYRARIAESFPGAGVVHGHIGDSHIHVNLLPRSQDEFDRGKDFMTEIAAKAVSLGGTVSAEHGIGKRKRHFLELQYPPSTIQAMQSVKRRLDPQALLGQGTFWTGL